MITTDEDRGEGSSRGSGTIGRYGATLLAGLAVIALVALAWVVRAAPGGAPTGSAGPARTIQVDAAKGWQATGLTVTAGTRLRVEVTAGEWTYWIGVSPLQPGTGDDYICTDIMPVSACVEPMPYERKGALIGRVDGGPPFLIGQRNEIAVDRDGLVELRINDPDSALHDNGGILTIVLGDAAGDPYPAPSAALDTPPPATSAEPSREPIEEPPGAETTVGPPTAMPAPTEAGQAPPMPSPVLPLALPGTGGGSAAEQQRGR